MVSINDAKKEHIKGYQDIINKYHEIIDRLSRKRRKYQRDGKNDLCLEIDGIIDIIKEEIKEIKNQIKEVYGQFGR